jgi:hypothetical protein
MTLPITGSISMSQVAAELGLPTTGINLNSSAVRVLAGKSTGVISMNDLRGKSAETILTLTSGTYLLNNGWVNATFTGFSSVHGVGSLTPTLQLNDTPFSIVTFQRRVDHFNNNATTYELTFPSDPTGYNFMDIFTPAGVLIETLPALTGNTYWFSKTTASAALVNLLVNGGSFFIRPRV